MHGPDIWSLVYNLIDSVGANVEITDLLVKSGQLMLVGMLVVFAFLGALVFCTKYMSHLVGKYQIDTETPTAKTLPVTQGNIAPQTVAAITAAIHQYRKSK